MGTIDHAFVVLFVENDVYLLYVVFNVKNLSPLKLKPIEPGIISHKYLSKCDYLYYSIGSQPKC